MPRVKSQPVSKRQIIDVDLENEQENEEEITERRTSIVRKNKIEEYQISNDFRLFCERSSLVLTINYVNNFELLCEDFLLGKFMINFEEQNVSIDSQDVNLGKLYLYITNDPQDEFQLYFENSSKKLGENFRINLIETICQGNYTKKFDYDFADALKYSNFFLSTYLIVQNNQLAVEIYLKENAIKKMTDYTPLMRQPNVKIQIVMKHLFDCDTIFECPLEPHLGNLVKIYDLIKKSQEKLRQNLGERDVQHELLLPTLRNYQIEAVKWMLLRETKPQNIDQILFQEIKLQEQNKILYYDRHCGYFIDYHSILNMNQHKTPLSGILADEMGLGKTIEVLALILNNPKSGPKQIQEIEADSSLKNKRMKSCFECICGNNDNAYYNEIILQEVSKRKRKKLENNHVKSDNVEEEKTFRRVKVKKQKPSIRCDLCGCYQHAKCVNLDLNKYETFYCAHCWVKDGMDLVDSRATLIVSPRSISHQWQDEIVKHINCSQLSIYEYTGVKSRNGYIQPYDLADNDIVLITYDTLRSELDYVDLQNSNKLRNPKRFNTTPTPLLSINWWRICLDEAQMVDSANTKVAQMALKLSAKHRWCITGTPIQRSVADLYGLLLFTGETPYNYNLFWNNVLYKQYCAGNLEPIVSALSRCFWRTTKREVWEQLGIPSQHETIENLYFSPVEKHFYMRQHEECRRNFLIKISNFTNLNVLLKNLNKKIVNIIMQPFLALRQACCHPQAVRGKFLPISKRTMTMKDLLDEMIKRTQYECEEEHRKFVAALNGIAAIYMIKDQCPDAIETYRSALNSIDNYKEKNLFRTDKLQQYHTLYNLAEVLELCGVQQKQKPDSIESSSNSQENHKINNVATSDFQSNSLSSQQSEESDLSVSKTVDVNFGRTLRDEYMRYEAQLLKNNYLSKESEVVMQTIEERRKLTEKVENVTKEFVFSKKSPWWIRAINYLIQLDCEDLLVNKVKTTLEDHDLRGRLGEEQLSSFVSISDKFREASGLKMVLLKCLDDLSDARNKVKTSVINLTIQPNETDLNRAIDCHLRPVLDKEGNRTNFDAPKCIYCLIHDLFNNYEAKLYYFSQEEKVEEETDKKNALMDKLRRGNWGDSEAEQSLKIVLSLFKSKANLGDVPEFEDIANDGNRHLKYYEALKKEFRGLRAVWMQIRDFAALTDELNMATIRLRLRYPNEPKPDIPLPYILERNEVDLHLSTLNTDKIIAKNALQKKLSHLYFLNNLSKADYGKKGGSNPELCPICQYSMGTQWAVLECGHSFCIKCIDIMLTSYVVQCNKQRSIKCAMCRQMCMLKDILYVDSKSEDEQDNDIEVEGSWSTKVEAIVKRLLAISKNDPHAKTLVFSSWHDVLELISKALEVNKYNHLIIKHSNLSRFPRVIDQFKQEQNIKALLLPINTGSKGLNLIEATHVILVEPTLNQANELQAIGRVHRIGQTKPTFVHKFIVKSTIEERIFELYSSNHNSEEFNSDEKKAPQLAESSEHAFITLNDVKKLFEDD